MELLRAIVGTSCHDDVLSDALSQYDGDVERAANYLLDQSVATPVPQAGAVDNGALEVELQLQTLAPDMVTTFSSEPPPPSLPLTCFPDIDNGDCVYFCMRRILEMLSPVKSRLSRPLLATQMRCFIENFLEARWSSFSRIASMTWCDQITMTQNTAVAEEEQSTYGEWMGTDADRLSSWMRERADMFGGVAEITAFVELLAERGVPLSIRIWRKYGRSVVMSTKIQAPDFSRGIVADFLHSGEMDSNTAHMRLLSNASFVRPPRTPLRRKRRSDTDPDYVEKPRRGQR